MKGGSLMFTGLDEENKRGLKYVLENKKICKLIHDCRNDWDSLLHQYSVRIYNFVDTQEAYFIFKLFYFQEITLPISLLKFIESMTNEKLQFKDKFKVEMANNPEMWAQRPLSYEQLVYASQDVLHLAKAWKILLDSFNANLKEIVKIIYLIYFKFLGIFFEYFKSG
jgi:exonuclease 3'-5' domain-containing protein 1